jgi:DNA-binding FrmR family transcriptional regulator
MQKNNQAQLLLKIKKAQGQLAKVAEMMENGDYCIDIIHQNLAVIGLLKAAQQDLLTNHLQHCFAQAVDNPRRKTQMINELIKVCNYLNR